MIKVTIKEKNDNIDKIIIKGHALFDDYGKDIVCSAVSSIVTTTINCVLALKEDGLKYNSKEGFVEITDIKGESSFKLINVMITMLKELENNYPSNIKIGKEC